MEVQNDRSIVEANRTGQSTADQSGSKENVEKDNGTSGNDQHISAPTDSVGNGNGESEIQNDTRHNGANADYGNDVSSTDVPSQINADDNSYGQPNVNLTGNENNENTTTDSGLSNGTTGNDTDGKLDNSRLEIENK